MLEWLAHGTLHQNPGLSAAGIDDLRILQGLKLQDESSVTMRVLAGKAEPGDGACRSAVELWSRRSDGRETIHARGRALLTDRLPPEPQAAPLPDWPPFPHTLDRVYSDLLFHGRELHGIAAVEGCCDAGIIGTVRSAPVPGGWLKRPCAKWLTDPLIVDAALQLMVLWCRQQCGIPGLPCFARSFRQFRRTFPGDGARVVCRIAHVGRGLATADIDFLDHSGEQFARMEGCEYILDAGLTRAFRHNRVGAAAHAV